MIQLQVKTSCKATWVNALRECEAQQYADHYAQAWRDATVAVYNEVGQLLARARLFPRKRESEEERRAKSLFGKRAKSYLRAKEMLSVKRCK